MQVSCLTCGKLFPQGNGRSRCPKCHTAKRSYYDTARQGTARRDRSAYKTPEWRKARASAISRTSGMCERCYSPNDLTVHHILPLIEGGTHDQTNLQVLCRTCHPIVEAEHRALRRQSKGQPPA